MNVYRRYPARALFALTAALLVLVIGAAAAFGRATPPPAGKGAGTAIAMSPPDAVVGSGMIAPTWCCGSSGTVPGLTTYGQATMDGQGQDARDAAIVAAVKDATAQANAAAEAAGIQLDAIIDMQVSATPYLYPMAQDIGGASTGAPGGAGMTKPAPMPETYLGSVSVTVTWSLG